MEANLSDISNLLYVESFIIILCVKNKVNDISRIIYPKFLTCKIVYCKNVIKLLVFSIVVKE